MALCCVFQAAIRAAGSHMACVWTTFEVLSSRGSLWHIRAVTYQCITSRAEKGNRQCHATCLCFSIASPMLQHVASAVKLVGHQLQVWLILVR